MKLLNLLETTKNLSGNELKLLLYIIKNQILNGKSNIVDLSRETDMVYRTVSNGIYNLIEKGFLEKIGDHSYKIKPETIDILSINDKILEIENIKSQIQKLENRIVKEELN